LKVIKTQHNTGEAVNLQIITKVFGGQIWMIIIWH